MARRSRVLDINELALTLRELKRTGKSVVHCHGVFDILHVGHIRHFEEAKSFGDVLVVTVTADQFVNKGPHRPAFPQDLRAEAIAALGVVDYVAVNKWPQAVETIALLRPDIYVKGPDYRDSSADVTGGISAEADAIRAVGGVIRFTDDIVFSSSALVNRHLAVFTPEVEEYLDAFRRRRSADEVLQWLDRGSRLRPVVVGEAIVDEYLFCDGIGKSTKDPVLTVLEDRIERYAGGALAIANHLAGLCKEVGLVTQLGDTERREDFVREALRSNVVPELLTKSQSPTIHKRRVVDRYSGNKLLEIYRMSDRPTSAGDAEGLRAAITATRQNSDLVVTADYGHGMLDPASIATLCDGGGFLALNVQSNAGNHGFNPVSKYPRADYVCLAAHEIEIETRQREGDIRERMLEVARRIACPSFTVTLGKQGSIHYDQVAGFTQSPALATRVLDRVGAGDAVLAVTSLLVRAGAPWDIVSFVGNVAGAELVAELGNKAQLEAVAFNRHVVSLMK